MNKARLLKLLNETPEQNQVWVEFHESEHDYCEEIGSADIQPQSIILRTDMKGQVKLNRSFNV